MYKLVYCSILGINAIMAVEKIFILCLYPLKVEILKVNRLRSVTFWAIFTAYNKIYGIYMSNKCWKSWGQIVLKLSFVWGIHFQWLKACKLKGHAFKRSRYNHPSNHPFMAKICSRLFFIYFGRGKMREPRVPQLHRVYETL